ncbi:MAG: hypothetical protein K2J24_07780, partial [Muribaculaceae bacterium]|nr:hypothetical protein [Muribaculaceae bacterium]
FVDVSDLLYRIRLRQSVSLLSICFSLAVIDDDIPIIYAKLVTRLKMCKRTFRNRLVYRVVSAAEPGYNIHNNQVGYRKFN